MKMHLKMHLKMKMKCKCKYTVLSSEILKFVTADIFLHPVGYGGPILLTLTWVNNMGPKMTPTKVVGLIKWNN